MRFPLVCPILDVAKLLPHSGHMVLIDRVTDYGADFAIVEASVGEAHMLLSNGTLPCIAAIEIMAQAIGAFAGICALNNHQPVRLGFLLGTRKLHLFADTIPVGTQLCVTAKVSTQDQSGMGVFDCEMCWVDAPESEKPNLPLDGVLAQAALNVYSPKEVPHV